MTGSRHGRQAGAHARLVIGVALLVAGCGALAPTASPSSRSPVASAAPTSSAPSTTSTPSPAASPAPVKPIRWSDCGKGFQCGNILAPLDYDDPAHGSVRLALIRLPATDRAKRIGSLFVNPGGPGESGIDFVREGAKDVFSKEIRARFDIVGFDPRGVNQSTPIRCVDDLDHVLAADLTPDTASERATLLAITQEFVDGCQRRAGELLPFVGTGSVARDLDRMRQALGDTSLTYVGFSYGTLIGALYAERYPNRIRALVLDGVVEPSLDLESLRRGQAVAFEAAFTRFLADCAKRTACTFRHAGRPGPAFDALMREIEKAPLRAKLIGDRRLVGPSYAWSAVIGALYSKETWPALAAALSLAERGDGSLLLLLADPYNGRKPQGGYSNLIDANRAVDCLDLPGPRDPAAYEAFADRLEKEAPRFGRIVALADLDCAVWPVEANRVPTTVHAPGAPPIVVVGSTGDPATPYQWSVDLARELDSGVLIKRTGEGHTGYLFSTCVKRAVDAYVLDLKVPTDGLACT